MWCQYVKPFCETSRKSPTCTCTCIINESITPLGMFCWKPLRREGKVQKSKRLWKKFWTTRRAMSGKKRSPASRKGNSSYNCQILQYLQDFFSPEMKSFLIELLLSKFVLLIVKKKFTFLPLLWNNKSISTKLDQKHPFAKGFPIVQING